MGRSLTPRRWLKGRFCDRIQPKSSKVDGSIVLSWKGIYFLLYGYKVLPSAGINPYIMPTPKIHLMPQKAQSYCPATSFALFSRRCSRRLGSIRWFSSPPPWDAIRITWCCVFFQFAQNWFSVISGNFVFHKSNWVLVSMEPNLLINTKTTNSAVNQNDLKSGGGKQNHFLPQKILTQTSDDEVIEVEKGQQNWNAIGKPPSLYPVCKLEYTTGLWKLWS